MKKKSIGYVMSIMMAFTLIFNSCVSDLDISKLNTNIGIDQSLVMPLGSSTLTLKDILTQFNTGSIKAPDGTSELYFMKNDTISDFQLKFNFADNITPTTVNFNFTNAIFPPSIPIQIPIPSSNIDLGVNNGKPGSQYLDSLIGNSVSMEITLDASSELKGINPSDVTLELDFGKQLVPNDGKKIVHTITQWGVKKDLNISNFRLYGLDNGKTGKRVNTLPLSIKVLVNPQASALTLTPASFLKLDVKVKSIDYDRVYGEFDPSVIGIKQESFAPNLEAFVPNSFLCFVDPSFKLVVETNVGTNINVDLDSLHSLNTGVDGKMNLTKFCTFIPGDPKSTKYSKVITGPTKIGEWTKDSIVLNRANGRTDLLFDSTYKPVTGQQLYPDWIKYKLSFSKDTKSTRVINYITKDSKYKMSLETKIPMNFKKNTFYSLADTIDSISSKVGSSLDLPEKYAQEAKLVFSFNNGLPARAVVTARLLDDKGVQIGSFTGSDGKTYNADDFKGTVDQVTGKVMVQGPTFPLYLNAPTVDANGNFVSFVPQQAVVSLTAGGIKALKIAKKLIFNIVINGSPNKNDVKDGSPVFPIHFSQNNSFSVKMGVYVKGNGQKIK
jgi:hypothetical protein